MHATNESAYLERMLAGAGAGQIPRQRRLHSYTASAKDGAQSPTQDLKIKPKIPIADIFDIECNTLLERRILPCCHLPQSRDTGHEIQPSQVVSAVALKVVGRMRSRSHQTHVAA